MLDLSSIAARVLFVICMTGGEVEADASVAGVDINGTMHVVY